MNSFIKQNIEKLFPVQALRYRAYHNLIRNPNSYLHLTGWMQSLKERRPMDHDGNPIPWMSFSAVRFLEERLTSDLNLFEYGSGYSTRFYAERVRSVISLEYDKSWFDIIQSQVPSNAKILFQEKDVDGAYCRAIGTTGERFDVVIVDGRDRVNCVKQGIEHLTPKGVVLLDDSQRERYQEAIAFAKQRGFKALNLEGLKATGVELDRTTLFYREGNCLGV